MNAILIIQAVVVVYLILCAAIVNSYGLGYKIFFKALPIVLAIILGCTTYAQFMGWPV